MLNGLYNQNLNEYNAKKSGLAEQLSGLQSAEQQAYSNYQKDLANWQNELAYRQNEYNNAYSEAQQNKRSFWDGLLNVVGIGLSILPFFL